MKKHSSLLLILFLLVSAPVVKAQNANISAGLDLLGGFRKTLELSLQYRPAPYLALNVSGGKQFLSGYSETYKDESENRSSYSVATEGLFARIGPCLILKAKNSKESVFAGLNLVYSSWSVSANTETETYYGPFTENYDSEWANLSLDMNVGVTLHLSDQIALDLGTRFSSFNPIAFPFAIEKYDHPGVGKSTSNNEGERPEKDMNVNLFANFRIFFGN